MLSVDYQYDGNGNRIKKTEGERETRYRYNQKNQLFQKEDADGISCFIYDRQGGIIEEKTAAGNRRFTYNSLHQQTQVETETGNIQKNRYDAEGLRYELIENGRRTSFVYHNGELLHEKGGEAGLSKEATSYHLGAGIEAFQRDSKTYYYHQDEQLNTTLITDEERKLRNHYQYDAFGAGLEAVEALPNRIRYTGQQYDEQTEQYYLRARYYNPILGRFMQEDVYQGDGLNLYAYCRNSPVVYYDPSGYIKAGTIANRLASILKNKKKALTAKSFPAVFKKKQKIKVYLGMEFDKTTQKYKSTYVGITTMKINKRWNKHKKDGKNFVELVQIAEFEHRYKAKGYEQTIIEFKTDPRLNTGETYINEINSIDRIKKKVLYDQATEWAILDMYNKGFLSEKGELLIPAQFEKKYNEEHKNSSCS